MGRDTLSNYFWLSFVANFSDVAHFLKGHSNALANLRDIWLDNVKNLRQYILRYTVVAATS